MNPATLPDMFSREIDGTAVQFVRPADTDRPCWVVYEDREPLGTIHVQIADGITDWIVQATHKRHPDLDAAVRALRQLQGRSSHQFDAIE